LADPPATSAPNGLANPPATLPPMAPRPAEQSMPSLVVAPIASPDSPSVAPQPGILESVSRWWSDLLKNFDLFDDQPSREQMVAIAATARNPATGNVSLDSLPMQCAVECQSQLDQRMSQCARAKQNATSSIGCREAALQSYRACHLDCGLALPKLADEPPSRRIDLNRWRSPPYRLPREAEEELAKRSATP
jgi:hypothetical protein